MVEPVTPAPLRRNRTVLVSVVAPRVPAASMPCDIRHAARNPPCGSDGLRRLLAIPRFAGQQVVALSDFEHHANRVGADHSTRRFPRPGRLRFALLNTLIWHRPGNSSDAEYAEIRLWVSAHTPRLGIYPGGHEKVPSRRQEKPRRGSQRGEATVLTGCGGSCCGRGKRSGSHVPRSRSSEGEGQLAMSDVSDGMMTVIAPTWKRECPPTSLSSPRSPFGFA